MRFHIGDILDIATGDAELETRLRRAMCDLADELNSGLGDYEVMIVHLDTADYLTFNRADSDAERLAAGQPVPCAICGREVQPGEPHDTTVEGAVICETCTSSEAE